MGTLGIMESGMVEINKYNFHRHRVDFHIGETINSVVV